MRHDLDLRCNFSLPVHYSQKFPQVTIMALPWLYQAKAIIIIIFDCTVVYLSMSLLISHSNTVGPSSQAASARYRTATVFTERWQSPNFFIKIASTAKCYLALLSSAAWYCTSWARAVGGGVWEKERVREGEREAWCTLYLILAGVGSTGMVPIIFIFGPFYLDAWMSWPH